MNNRIGSGVYGFFANTLSGSMHNDYIKLPCVISTWCQPWSIVNLCTAPLLRLRMQVQIGNAPKSTTTGPKEYRAYVGASMVLTCQSTYSTGIEKYNWDSSNCTGDCFAMGGTSSVSTDFVQLDHSGVYTCKVSRAAVTKSISISLIPLGEF